MVIKMENRLCLNKKPTYELPDEVIIGVYENRPYPKYLEPKWIADIAINNIMNPKSCIPKTFNREIWIKTDNKDLIEFIKKYDWDVNQSMTFNSITKTDVEKIILEEFYRKNI